MTTSTSGNVVPFRNIGTFIEELTSFAGDNSGVFGANKIADGHWQASLTIDNGQKNLVKDGDTFNNAVLALWRATVKLAKGQ